MLIPGYQIFTHLLFYLDRGELNRKNGLGEKKGVKGSAIEAETKEYGSTLPCFGSFPTCLTSIANRFDALQTLITSNGGKVTDDLMSGKLTHIIQLGGGAGRYKELRKVSSK